MSLSATQVSAQPNPLSMERPKRAPLHRMIHAMAREWHAFHATRSLEALDDRALTDIGVSRALIDHAVRYGRPPRG